MRHYRRSDDHLTRLPPNTVLPIGQNRSYGVINYPYTPTKNLHCLVIRWDHEKMRDYGGTFAGRHVRI